MTTSPHYLETTSHGQTLVDADPHLADRDGNQTSGDRDLIAIRDLLEQFLRTSCARYLVAAEQVRNNADDYVDEDTAQRSTFNNFITGWKREGIDDVALDFDPERAAQATDRSGHDPYAGNPVLEGSPPGRGDGESYVTETGDHRPGSPR